MSKHTTHHDDCGCKSAEYEQRLAAKDAEIAKLRAENSVLRDKNRRLWGDRKTHDDYVIEASAVKDKHIRNIQRQAKIEAVQLRGLLRHAVSDLEQCAQYTSYESNLTYQIKKALEATK